MKKIFLFLLTFIFTLSTSIAQNNKSSLLWEISGNGLEKPSYLFGTIHLICPKDYAIPAALEPTIEKSELVVLELDMDDPSFRMEMQQLMVNEGMRNISSDMAPKDLAILDDFLMKNYNTEMSQVGIFKPMALMSMVMVKSYDCDTTKSVEEFVLRFATKNELEIKGLETATEQLSIFDSIPTSEQIDWITEMIRDSIGTRENIAKFVEVYNTGDVDNIYKLSVETYPSVMEYEELLMYSRNRKWIPKIKKIINEQSTFFAVGAGHLGSDKGVIRLLENEGFTLTPLPLN